MNHPRVIAGLDPAIHPAKPKILFYLMDARVEPAHDGVWDDFVLCDEAWEIAR